MLIGRRNEKLSFTAGCSVHKRGTHAAFYLGPLICIFRFLMTSFRGEQPTYIVKTDEWDISAIDFMFYCSTVILILCFTSRRRNRPPTLSSLNSRLLTSLPVRALPLSAFL